MAKIIKIAKDRLEDAPIGNLRIAKSQGCIQYYHCTDETTHNGVYLPKKELGLVKKLAQKAYDKKVLKYAEKTYSQITRLLNEFQDDKLERIYLSENINRRELIEPVEETFEMKLEKWLSHPYKSKAFNEGAPVIKSDNGIQVRSKSERLMANFFDSVGLKYKYECPLLLKPYGIIYPDFTFLSPKTGKEIYWEHEGMLDNPEYAQTAAKKIELYEKNGILPGDNLILTFETTNSILDKEILRIMVERYFDIYE